MLRRHCSIFLLTPASRGRTIRFSEEQFPSFGMQHPLRRTAIHPGLRTNPIGKQNKCRISGLSPAEGDWKQLVWDQFYQFKPVAPGFRRRLD